MRAHADDGTCFESPPAAGWISIPAEKKECFAGAEGSSTGTALRSNSRALREAAGRVQKDSSASNKSDKIFYDLAIFSPLFLELR